MSKAIKRLRDQQEVGLLTNADCREIAIRAEHARLTATNAGSIAGWMAFFALFLVFSGHLSYAGVLAFLALIAQGVKSYCGYLSTEMQIVLIREKQRLKEEEPRRLR